ncbi:hypothetical protein JHW43_004805 [Diplocarpon mali]|nr:hypothetical protein JHW43_004805 [Diplocarpon mali]
MYVHEGRQLVVAFARIKKNTVTRGRGRGAASVNQSTLPEKGDSKFHLRSQPQAEAEICKSKSYPDCYERKTDLRPSFVAPRWPDVQVIGKKDQLGFEASAGIPAKEITLEVSVSIPNKELREQDLRRLMSDIQRILSEETRNVSSTVLETFRNTMQYLKSEETIRRGRTPLEQHTHRFLRDCSRPFMDAVRRRTPFPDPTDKAQDPQLLGARKLSDSSNSPIPQGRCAVEVAPISDVLCYPKHALDLSDSGDDLPKCDDNGEDEDDSSVSSEDSFELWDQKMAAADMHKAEDSSVFSPASDLSDGEDFKPSVKRSTATTPARLSRTYCIRSAKLLKSIEMDDFERERSVIPEIPGTPCPASSWRNFDPSNDHRPHSPFAQTPCSASRFSKPSPQKTPSSTNSVSIGPRSSEPAIETASTRSIQRCSVVEVSTGSQPKTPKERILKRYYVSPESQYKASPPTSHRNGSKAPKLKLKVSSSASCKLQSVIDLSHNTPSETPSRPRRPRAASRQPQLSWNIEESIVIPHASISDTSFALSGEEGNLSASRSRHSVSEKSLPPEPIVKKSRTILDTILFPRNSIPHPVVKLPRPGVSAARQKRKKPSPAGSKAQSRRQIRAVELAELAKDLSSSLCENIERVFDQR